MKIHRNILLRTVIGAILLLGAGGYSFGQVAHGGTPYSFRHKAVDAVATAVLPHQDNQRLMQEEIRVENKREGYLFGKEIAVNYHLNNAGRWEELPDGGRLWRLGIQSKGAYSINLLFDRFYIPPTSHLFIYTADRSFVLGSFTAENNNRWGSFATALLPGDAVVLQFYEAAQDREQATIRLSTVVHGYKDFFFQKSTQGTWGTSGKCNVNINCGIGAPFQEAKRAVALVLNSNRAFCSGTLINNTAQDTTPYFLTAYHCVKRSKTSASGYVYNPANFVFIFNYEINCEGQNSTKTYSVSGATVVAMDTMSDFALLLLNDRPPVEYNPYYAGWSRKDTLYKGVVTIHHPNGDWKKISRDRKTIASGKFYADDTNYADNTHFIVVWDTGTTEHGSSGSGLFNRDKLLIGQLEGGTAKCSNRDGEDFYGKIAYSWTNNNSSDSNRLDYWLDPLGLGVEFLEGLDIESQEDVRGRTISEETVSVYPNPTSGKLKVESGMRTMSTIAVYDIVGRKIIDIADIQHNEFLLDVEKLHAGLYILKIETEKGVFTKKIVKQ